MSRSWMYNKNLAERGGLTEEFYQGVTRFINFALSKSVGDEIRCPCRKCANQKWETPEVVRGHLYRKGFVENYYRWIFHGEPPIQSSPNPVPTTQYAQTFPLRQEYGHLNPQQQMVFDVAGPSFVPYWENQNSSPSLDQLQTQPSSSNYNVGSPNIQSEMNVNMGEQTSEGSVRFWDVLKAAEQPIWEGCDGESQLSTVTELLQMKSEFNMSENLYNKICQWAGKRMPRDHKLPKDYYQSKKLVKPLGLPMEKIDMCPKGCMLYWKDDVELQCCKFCNEDRYKHRGKKVVSRKQLRYFPLIPRLQRLYASRATAEHMRWHGEHKSKEGIMSHPSDSEEWKHFDKTHPDFANEFRNVRLALCSDGFSPFSRNGKPYSCWPVIVTPYNLPLSMCLKTPCMFLAMIIPGPKNPKKLIDICLQPLIEELLILWTQGVPTFDISRGEYFLMRAALLWTINDFPAYGMLAGWSTSGLLACPICMNDIKSFWLEHSKKPSWFDCHRPHLPHDHPLRRNRKAFYRNRVETSPPPRRLTGEEIWNCVKDLPTAMEAPYSTIPGYLTHHKWTKKSIFWQLPYWKSLLIRHNLDVMHVEKNVFDNVFNTVMDIKDMSKDTLNSRKDLKLHCNRPELEVDEDYCGKKPKAVYTLRRDQKKQVCEWIKSLKFPDGYASNIGNCVQLDECKLIGMKSHDCHVFMQRLISIAFKEMLPDSVWEPLTELSQFFHSLCSPTLSIAHMEELQKAAPLILCKLERIFPPSFFDSMEHLLIHLPFEAKVAGPVQYRWMYPFERFLHHLKEKVKASNKARVEASICASYLMEETSRLSSHYFNPEASSSTKKARQSDEGPSQSIARHFSIFNYPGRGFGKPKSRYVIDPLERHAIETYVLLNCDEVQWYSNEFSIQMGGANIYSDFASWFSNYVLITNNGDAFIRSLARGAKAMVTTWPGYTVNGYTFHTSKRGEGKSTMNSGVCVKASDSNEDEYDFYGLLEEIIQTEYSGLPQKEVVLFKCRWFDPIRGTRTHKKYDLVEINPRQLYKRNDPFIFAQQAIQVYYAPYPGAKGDRANWQAVCKTKARGTIEQSWTDLQETYQPDDAVRVPIVDDTIIENLQDPREDEFVDDESEDQNDDDEEVNEKENNDDDEDGEEKEGNEEDEGDDEDDLESEDEEDEF